MNMLNPGMKALASFSDSDREEFVKLMKNGHLEVLSVGGKWVDREPSGDLSEGVAYRLKLVEDCFYTFGFSHEKGYCTFKYSGETHDNYYICDIFRPATQEEIDSVQPKPRFKRGDVVVGNSVICRFDYISDSNTIYSLSEIRNGGFEFTERDSIFLENAKLATKSQINQLELEETKAGKMWNGEGYDEWLTADGLTFSELVKYDCREIEYNDHECGWRSTVNNNSDFREIKMSIVYSVPLYRLKPKEEKSYADIEIYWGRHGAYIGKIDSDDTDMFKLSGLNVGGQIQDGWVLSGYIYSDGEFHEISPISFRNCGKKILKKATHARFVKVN